MAKKLLVSIRDVKVGEYLGLVQVRNTAEAERQFMALCMDSKSPMYSFPRDFQMHQVGTFDPESGVIEPCASVDLTPYTRVDELVARREREETTDFKLNDGMRKAVEYYRNNDNPRKDRVSL